MVRTAWLTLFCLLGVGMLAAIEISSNVSPVAVSAAIVESDHGPVPTADAPDIQQDTLRKADKLPTFHVDLEDRGSNPPLPTEVISVEPVPIVRETAPKIVGRHWHEPNPVATPERRRADRQSNKKKDADAVDAANEAKPCPQSGALLRILKLTPNCGGG